MCLLVLHPAETATIVGYGTKACQLLTKKLGLPAIRPLSSTTSEGVGWALVRRHPQCDGHGRCELAHGGR